MFFRIVIYSSQLAFQCELHLNVLNRERERVILISHRNYIVHLLLWNSARSPLLKSKYIKPIDSFVSVRQS